MSPAGLRAASAPRAAHTLLVASLALATITSAASAQPIPEFTLAPADVEFDLGDASVASGAGSRRALLLGAGGREPRLRRVDLASRTVTDALPYDTPDGFRSIGPLWAWPGDSLALVDFRRGELLVFSPDAELVRRIVIGDSAAGRRPQLPGLRFLVNTTGAVGPGAPTRRTNASGRPLLAIHRYDFATRRTDSVATYAGPPPVVPPDVNRNSGVVTVTLPTAPIEPADSWGAFADGTVAILRGSTYAIQLVERGGQRRLLPSLAVQRTPIDDALRKRFLAEAERGVRDGLRRSGQASRMGNLVIRPPDRFPDSLPHFRAVPAPMRDPLDRLWVVVWCAGASESEAACYDVIDRSGGRVVRLRLEPESAVIGFTPTSVLVLVEEKGRQRLRLHALP